MHVFDKLTKRPDKARPNPYKISSVQFIIKFLEVSRYLRGRWNLRYCENDATNINIIYYKV